MENASKALIIAGAILISIIIISLGVMVFRNMSGTVERNANLTSQQIASFNSKITPYIGENIPGSQVNALIQLARTINQNAINKGDTAQCISITNNSGDLVKKDNTVVKNVQTGSFYDVEGDYASNGLITTIRVSNPK